MTLSASPYAVFRPEDWAYAEVQPIGICQWLRLMPRNISKVKLIKKKRDISLKKVFSVKDLQLYFP